MNKKDLGLQDANTREHSTETGDDYHTDKLVLKDSRKKKVACFQLVNERTGLIYADIYSDGLADMIADHNYKVSS